MRGIQLPSPYKTRYVLPVPIRAHNNMCPCRFGHTLWVSLIAWPFIGSQPMIGRQSHEVKCTVYQLGLWERRGRVKDTCSAAMLEHVTLPYCRDLRSAGTYVLNAHRFSFHLHGWHTHTHEPTHTHVSRHTYTHSFHYSFPLLYTVPCK